MEYKIRYLPLAIEDIDSIASYLSKFYKTTAGKVLNKLEDQISKLKTMPLKYEIYKPNPLYRNMVVGDYLVFYVVNNETNSVDIHRILRGSWDIKL